MLVEGTRGDDLLSEYYNTVSQPQNQVCSQLVESPVTVGKVVKKGNQKRIKSAWRDAQFFQEFWAARQAAATNGLKGASVNTPNPPNPPFHSPSNAQNLVPPNCEKFVRGYGADHGALRRRNRVPADWRELSPQFAAFYHHHAAAESGPLFAFTLNLRPDVEAAARANSSAATWLLKRIRHHLKNCVPHEEPAFWFALEVTVRRRLHLHGEIVTTSPVDARHALRLAGGEWEKTRQHQARTDCDPDEGWLGYCFKEYGSLEKSRRNQSRGFGGHPFACTQNLTRLARSLYEIDRAEVLRKLKQSHR